MRNPVADEDEVLCVLTCIDMWEKEAVCKQVVGEDGVLCVLTCIPIMPCGKKGSCVSR